jgi:hypothetical protein
MPLVDLRRPAIQRLSDPRDALRVDQHQNDNIARLNQAFARFEDQEFVHGEPTLIPNPFGVSSGVHPVALLSATAAESDGTALRIANCIVGAPRTDGFLELTIEYDLRHTEPCMERLHNATQSIGDGATIDVAFNTPVFTRGSVITYSAPNFTVSEAGTYALYAATPLEGGGLTYDSADVWFDFGGSTISEFWIPATFNNGPRLVTTVTRKLAAGATFKVRCFQSNTAPASRNLMATQTTMAVHRLYNDTIPTGIVSGLLVA